MSTKENLAIDNGAKYRTDSWSNRGHFGIEEKEAAMKFFNESIAIL